MQHVTHIRYAGLFQSALPLRGATLDELAKLYGICDFNPRSPCGERPVRMSSRLIVTDFNPRSPCGERPRPAVAQSPVTQFQSALPLRGATYMGNALQEDLIFQSALPLRGATYRLRWPGKPQRFQSALPLRGATLQRTTTRMLSSISIRAPLAGSDIRRVRASARSVYFNPRSPCGERPLYFVASIYYQQSVVFSKTVAANSVDKLRKTTAKSAITRCEAHS